MCNEGNCLLCTPAHEFDSIQWMVAKEGRPKQEAWA